MPGDSMPGELARFLAKLTGVAVATTDFDEAALEPHLRMNLRLLDRDGKSVLAESRDLDALRRPARALSRPPAMLRRWRRYGRHDRRPRASR